MAAHGALLRTRTMAALHRLNAAATAAGHDASFCDAAVAARGKRKGRCKKSEHQKRGLYASQHFNSPAYLGFETKLLFKNTPHLSTQRVPDVDCYAAGLQLGSHPMLAFKLFYHNRYDLNLGAHVFPSQKYRLVRDALLAEKIAEPSDIVAPQPASDEDILRVHTREYVHKLKTGTLDYLEILRMEVPYSKELIEACWLAAGGSIEAGRSALVDGCSVNIGGGFHHAFSEHGEGFCVIHDVAMAIRRLQHDGAIENAMVIDTDVHQGNGTAAIFARDERVYTFSIHQEHNYPEPKPPSNLDANLPDGIGDEGYLAILDSHLRRAFTEFTPELVFYVAGADPYCEDQLGGLALTMEGLRRRDQIVYEHCRRHGVPFAITLAGGYARRVADTVRIHVNTIAEADSHARKFDE